MEKLDIFEVALFIFPNEFRHSLEVGDSHEEENEQCEEVDVNQADEEKNKGHGPVDRVVLVEVHSRVQSGDGTKQFSNLELQMEIVFIGLCEDSDS